MTDRKTRSLEAALSEAKRQFSTKPYDAVSVNDIAGVAHCSTTTIYDAFGNKMGLYVAAARDYVASLLDEIEAHQGNASGLEQLINHLELRAERFATPAVREMVRNVITRVSAENFKSTPEMRASLVAHYLRVIEVIQQAIDQGDLLTYPKHHIADMMLAHIGWRPLFHGLLLGSNDALNVSPPELAIRSLLPYLTAKGRRTYAGLRPALTELIDSMP